MSSINKLIANVKKTSSLTSSFINNDSSYICIDTSTNRIGFNTQEPSYSIHIVDNNGIICVSNIDVSNLYCDVSGYIKDLSCINFDVDSLKVDSSFIVDGSFCSISCDAIDFCNSKLTVFDLSVNNDLSVNTLKYKTLDKITILDSTGAPIVNPDNFDKVIINDCSINQNLDISGILTFPINSNSINEFNCFNAETSFNIIRTQDISCANEISCNDICCNDISTNILYVSKQFTAVEGVLETFHVIRDISCTDISCTEISCNIISCNDICANNLYIYNDISCINKIITNELEIKEKLEATGKNITLERIKLKECKIDQNLVGLQNSKIDISKSQLIIPDISYVNNLTTGSIYFDSSLQSIKVIHDSTNDQSYNIFYNKKFVNVELSYNKIIPTSDNNRNDYQNKIDTSYTDFVSFDDNIRDNYVNNFISTDTDISYLNIPLDISYNNTNVDYDKFYDISDATILRKDVDRIKIIYNDFVDAITLSSSNPQFSNKNIFFNINAYVTLKYFNEHPNDVEVISYDFEMMNTGGAYEGDVLTKSKNTIISFDNSYNYSTSNLNYVGKLENGTADINSYIYFRIKTDNNKDISNLLLYDFNCSVVQI
tara:strand:- start:10193 stop:11998 length:1806 start_codon:yes stop_codon:yes gene_type:complete